MKKINWKEKYKIIEKFFANMEDDYISESSAQCSYYTILSFIPFIILVITLIQYTNIEPQTLFDAISKFIPSSLLSARAWAEASITTYSTPSSCILAKSL